MEKWFSLNEFYFSGRTRLEERLAAAIIGIEFSFESGLVSSDLAVLVRAEVMMQAEDDNHQDNVNDCVERQPCVNYMFADTSRYASPCIIRFIIGERLDVIAHRCAYKRNKKSSLIRLKKFADNSQTILSEKFHYSVFVSLE